MKDYNKLIDADQGAPEIVPESRIKPKRKYRPVKWDESTVWSELVKVLNAKAKELGRRTTEMGAWVFDDEVEKQLIKNVADKLDEEFRRVNYIFIVNTGG
jgi:hypothetical protein